LPHLVAVVVGSHISKWFRPHRFGFEMIALTATNEVLEITTSAAVAVDVTASWVDHTSTGGTLGSGQTLVTTATTAIIVPAPAASTQRQVKFVNALNTSGTAVVVTFKKDAGGTEFDLITLTLGPGERAEYTDGKGWTPYTNSGAIKTSINQGVAPITSALSAAVLSSNVVNNNATANTMQDVTGLSFPVLAGRTYYFQFQIQYSAAATTTGSRWSINGPSFTRLNYISEYSLTTTTSTRNAQNTAYNVPAASNASSATTGSNWAMIEGMITPSADGTVVASFASEIANSAITALAGSVVYYQQLN
jgi:hypothetical protein